MEDFRLENLTSLTLFEAQLTLDEHYPGHRVLQIIEDNKTVTRIKGPLLNIKILSETL